MQEHLKALRLAVDPACILAEQGLPPDPWQRDVLLCPHRQILVNCNRQAGKSTAAAALGLHTALYQPGSLTLILSRGIRQSMECFRKILDAYNALNRPTPPVAESLTKLELANGSRIVCLPGKEDTVRSFSAVALLIIDEAARVPDDLYRAVRPMLAVSQGRLIAVSTPFGLRGWWSQEWHHGGAAWHRVRVPWTECPRIAKDFIDSERKSMGDSWVKQEYECSFESLEGLVYPDFDTQVAVDFDPPPGKWVGGIDWGFRNPFCALWGVLTYDDVLWLCDERYLRETPLAEHAQQLPTGVDWYADPAGAQEINSLRRYGHTVRKGDNDIRPGIAAVTARVQTGRLKIVKHRCPNVFSEAQLYRYGESLRGSRSEIPIDENNHALAALRYLVAGLDRHFMAKYRRHGLPRATEAADPETAESVYGVRTRPRKRIELDINNPDIWTCLN